MYLESLGFETLHRSEGFSNHLHGLGGMRIDLVYIEGETARAVFLAIQNDPERKFKELGDIAELFRRVPLDMELMRRQFLKYGLEGYFDEITQNTRR